MREVQFEYESFNLRHGPVVEAYCGGSVVFTGLGLADIGINF